MPHINIDDIIENGDHWDVKFNVDRAMKEGVIRWVKVVIEESKPFEPTTKRTKIEGVTEDLRKYPKFEEMFPDFKVKSPDGEVKEHTERMIKFLASYPKIIKAREEIWEDLKWEIQHHPKTFATN